MLVVLGSLGPVGAALAGTRDWFVPEPRQQDSRATPTRSATCPARRSACTSTRTAGRSASPSTGWATRTVTAPARCCRPARRSRTRCSRRSPHRRPTGRPQLELTGWHQSAFFSSPGRPQRRLPGQAHDDGRRELCAVRRAGAAAGSRRGRVADQHLPGLQPVARPRPLPRPATARRRSGEAEPGRARDLLPAALADAGARAPSGGSTGRWSTTSSGAAIGSPTRPTPTCDPDGSPAPRRGW